MCPDIKFETTRRSYRCSATAFFGSHSVFQKITLFRFQCRYWRKTSKNVNFLASDKMGRIIRLSKMKRSNHSRSSGLFQPSGSAADKAGNFFVAFPPKRTRSPTAQPCPSNRSKLSPGVVFLVGKLRTQQFLVGSCTTVKQARNESISRVSKLLTHVLQAARKTIRNDSNARFSVEIITIADHRRRFCEQLQAKH